MRGWTRWVERGVWTVLLVLLAYRFGPQVGAALGTGARDGAPLAEEVTFTSIGGEPIRLADLRGKVVVLNFWATWCWPCKVEMPALDRLYRDRQADGVEVLAVTTDGNPTLVQEYLAQRDFTFPVAWSNARAVRSLGGIRGTPTTILIDQQGRVRHQWFGITAPLTLRAAVGRLLRET
ncbi:MAG: TlpA disulfide reductase family protein [Gemmatimonadota bacterium]